MFEPVENAGKRVGEAVDDKGEKYKGTRVEVYIPKSRNYA